MTDNQKEILANLIKADLQNALTNDSRWKVEGISHYFQDYSVWRKSIFLDTNNKEIAKAVAENARRHSSQRKEKWEKEKRSVEKRGEKWSGNAEFKLYEDQIQSDELEVEDYQEIIRLINSEVKAVKDKKDQQKKQWVKEKLSKHAKMVYWGTKSPVTSIFKTGSWYSFEQKENGQGYSFYIPQNHPDLTNFPLEKEGFYLINFSESVPLETYTENGHTYWKKFLSLNDKITITPYEAATDSELLEIEKKGLEIKDCDVCQKNYDNTEKLYNIRRYHGQNGKIIQVCSNCYKNKEQEYLQNYEAIFSFPTNDGRILKNIKWGKIDCYAGKKDQSGQILQQQNCAHCQPWKQQEVSNSEKEKILTLLTQLFQKYNIKKITLKNGELVITNNNKTNNQLTNNSEYQLLKNSLAKINQTELTAQKLGLASENTTTNSDNSPSGNNYLWLVGAITLGIIVVGLLAFLLQRKKRKIN